MSTGKWTWAVLVVAVVAAAWILAREVKDPVEPVPRESETVAASTSMLPAPSRAERSEAATPRPAEARLPEEAAAAPAVVAPSLPGTRDDMPASATPSATESSPSETPVDPDLSESELRRLARVLRSKTSINEEILSALDVVHSLYHASHEGAQRRFQDKRDRAQFRKRASKLFLKALMLRKIHRPTNRNLRDDVNIRAAQILAKTGDATLSKKIRSTIERTLIREKYPVPDLLEKEMFAALAKLNDMDSLEWMMDEFIHTKASEADSMNAAHKAMLRFTGVPGKLRYAIVMEMLKTYSGLEVQAQQDSPDPKIRAAKRLWERIGADAIKVVQHFSGTPKDSRGEVLRTMAELTHWFREHKRPNDAAWKDD